MFRQVCVLTFFCELFACVVTLKLKTESVTKRYLCTRNLIDYSFCLIEQADVNDAKDDDDSR